MKFSEDTLRRFARELVKYPPEHKQSAVMACLAIVQQEQGYVSTEAEDALAAYLDMPAIAVHEVTTFYNMYNQRCGVGGAFGAAGLAEHALHLRNSADHPVGLLQQL